MNIFPFTYLYNMYIYKYIYIYQNELNPHEIHEKKILLLSNFTVLVVENRYACKTVNLIIPTFNWVVVWNHPLYMQPASTTTGPFFWALLMWLGTGRQATKNQSSAAPTFRVIFCRLLSSPRSEVIWIFFNMEKRLMVRKSPKKPPLGCMKPCKEWDF